MEDLFCQQFTQKLQEERHRLKIYLERFEGLSPLRKLNQGYAYISDDNGRNVSSVSQVSPGDSIEIAVTDGMITAEVTGGRKEKWKHD